MTHLQLVYASQPFGFDQGMLNGILLSARDRNAKDGVTGALICRRDLYLQLLEGPAEAVDAAFARIRRDDRHLEVTPLIRRDVPERLFGAWAMRDDPARSWMWSQAEVAGGAVTRASEGEITAVFERLSREAGLPQSDTDAAGCPVAH